MIAALNDIVKADGWKGLYRGLSPNVAGNSASWGLYFLWYTMIKERMSAHDTSPDPATGGPRKLSAGQHLLAASESGAITALMTNRSGWSRRVCLRLPIPPPNQPVQG